MPQYIAFPVMPYGKEHPNEGSGRSVAQIDCPGIFALVTIGDPCVPKVVDKLVATPHLAEATACAGVLKWLKEKQTGKIGEELRRATTALSAKPQGSREKQQLLNEIIKEFDGEK